MDQQKQAIVDRLKQSNNILVTVSTNPSVDQLAACIGLTLALNKMGKHATAVFSGVVPSTLEFLQPEKTLEKNTDSLRDFIIALDKSKADKLRYKVEDKVVKIFITPYKTSINEKDLEFSQGDFNVDVVLALGVHNQQDLDQAITAHGRILHDAVVGTINVKPGGEFGTLNWLETRASSLSELVAELVDAIDKALLDGQMATALLTGIVAETKRFSNDKTSPMTMSISAELMAAGANQQLVATKLETPPPPPPKPVASISQTPASDHQAEDMPKADDGTLEITHGDSDKAPQPALGGDESARPERTEAAEDKMPQIHIDEHGSLQTFDTQKSAESKPPELKLPELPKPEGSIDPTEHMASQHMILQPPQLGGDLTANASPEDIERPSGDPLSLPQPSSSDVPLLGHDSPRVAPPSEPPAPVASVATSPILPTPPPPPPALPTTLPPTIPGPTIVTPTVAPPQPQPAVLPTPPEPTPFVGSGSPLPPPISPAPAVITPSLPSLPPEPVLPTPPPQADETLSDLEQEVHSPHLAGGAPLPNNVAPTIMPPSSQPPASVIPSLPPEPPTAVPTPGPLPPTTPEPSAESESSQAEAAADLASAREAVLQAIASQSQTTPEPIQALNAQPLGSPLHSGAGDPNDGLGLPPSGAIPSNPGTPAPTVIEPTTPNPSVPPVPPPMMPPQNY